MSAEFGMRSAECERKDVVVLASGANQSCLLLLSVLGRDASRNDGEW